MYTRHLALEIPKDLPTVLLDEGEEETASKYTFWFIRSLLKCLRIPTNLSHPQNLEMSLSIMRFAS